MPRPAQPDAVKDCAGCGTRLSRREMQLDWDKWLRRRFCSDQCRRDRDAREGRTTGAYIGTFTPPKKLTREEHFAYWRERFTDQEIYDMASAIDTLVAEDEGRWEAA